MKDQVLKDRKNFDKQLQQFNSQMPGTPEKAHIRKSPSTPMLNPPTPNSLANSSSSSSLNGSQPATPLSASQSKSQITPSSSARGASHNEISMEILQNDINSLATQVGTLQNAKWMLEEKVKLLEETVNIMNDDIRKKETIIKAYITEVKVGRATPEMEKVKMEKTKKGTGISGFFSAKNDFTLELTQKMEAVLEDTLLKNIQLQNDIETLGDEITKLSEENKVLKKQKQEINEDKEDNEGK